MREIYFNKVSLTCILSGVLEMVKMGSRSRSRSRSPRERVDRFGRSIPSGSRSRTRTRSRSRSRSRDSRRRRSRSPRRLSSQGIRSYRRRSRSTSRPRFKDHRDKTITNIEDPEFLNARIFIGNLPSDRTTKPDLENLFQCYGKILGKVSNVF